MLPGRGRRFAFAAAAAVVVAAACLAWLWRPHRAAAELATQLAGERWYLVAFRHTPIGEYRTESGVNAAREFEFRAVLRFSLDGATETLDETRMVFGRWPPHRLRAADKRLQVGDATTAVSYRDGLATVIQQRQRRQLAAGLDYRLADHLAIERWLESPTAAPGDRGAGRSLDLERLVVAPVSWQLLERDAERTALAGAWLQGAAFHTAAEMSSRLTLDRQGVPLRVQVADVFTLQRVADADAAGIWRGSAPVFAARAARVAVDRPIAAPAALRALTLAVEGPGGASAWPATLAADVDVALAPEEAELAAARLPTVRYPADDPRLARLARRAVAGMEAPRDQVAALTRFVHRHLRYRDTSAVRTVLDTARDRAGDCTEFADLFTTLARSLGLAARTVVGLAYQADSQTFVLHAWNEAAVDGRWHGVDPTWDQVPSDATHLALPGKAALAAIAELPKLRFRILETRY